MYSFDFKSGGLNGFYQTQLPKPHSWFLVYRQKQRWFGVLVRQRTIYICSYKQVVCKGVIPFTNVYRLTYRPLEMSSAAPSILLYSLSSTGFGVTYRRCGRVSRVVSVKEVPNLLLVALTHFFWVIYGHRDKLRVRSFLVPSRRRLYLIVPCWVVHVILSVVFRCTCHGLNYKYRWLVVDK